MMMLEVGLLRRSDFSSRRLKVGRGCKAEQQSKDDLIPETPEPRLNLAFPKPHVAGCNLPPTSQRNATIAPLDVICQSCNVILYDAMHSPEWRADFDFKVPALSHYKTLGALILWAAMDTISLQSWPSGSRVTGGRIFS
jgi:hypothetical protein